MERTKLKGLRPKRIPSMKGSKEKENGPGACREDQEHQACLKSMQRGSRTTCAWEEDQKHEMCMERVQ
jgi:hypothetical protein